MPYSKNVLLAAIFLLSLVIVPAVPAQVPASNHVYIVLEENQNYSSIIGNTQMRYLNSLASTYGLATQYYANTHPSIGNYFMLTTGQIITNDDAFSGTVNADNIVRQLLSIGKTWKSITWCRFHNLLLTSPASSCRSIPLSFPTTWTTGMMARLRN